MISDQRDVETIVVGGSQSGLAVGHELAERGRRFLILDAHERVGDAWRHRWDSLRLFTTARYSSLPGMPFPGPPGAYPTKDAVADYLEAYAERFELPIATGVRVERATRSGQSFEIEAGEARFTARNLVVATGAFHRPRVPELADRLPPEILQLHSSRYRNPSQLKDGGVLVVGAGNSGAEIALELSRDRPTWLSGRDPGQEPTRAGSLPDRMLMPVLWFLATRVLTVGTPMGRKARDHFLHPPRGIPLGRVRRRDLRRAGVERVGRMVAVRDGSPLLDDGTVLDVPNVVWCTGFAMDHSWIDLPIEYRDGYPPHERGAVAGQPGLYFIGLPFIRSLSSALLGGVGRDAAHLADRIVSRAAAEAAATVAS